MTDDSAPPQRTPEEIRQDIDHQREELGDTVAALAQKADVKAQANAKAAELKQSAQQRKDDLLSRARQATPDSASAGATQVAGKARENPIPVATGAALLFGLLLGWLFGRRSEGG